MALGSAANSYEILSKLAEGGMAEIFLARSAGAGGRRYVVLKRVARERAGDTQYVRMFLDEAKLAAQLSHPNIAQVFDLGRLGTSYFFTMEYVHGVTVQGLIDRALAVNVPLPIGAVLAIIAGAAAGLGHAHQRMGVDGRPLGIVHRDVSPSNLMVSYEGHVKVVDFGVAKAVGRPETQAGEIKGKVAYLSPEQCRTVKLDRRSDLFSLGICAWEMLTGKRLFKRETAFETMAAIATEQAPPPSRLRPDLPPPIDELVMRLLAIEPKNRFQNADQVIEATEATSQRTTAAMSPQTLSRLLRDLFGVQPEPWLMLEREALTVISTPIPEDLESQDDPGAVDAKLTSQFTSVSGVLTPVPQLVTDTEEDDFSSTNILIAAQQRETRVVPVLANAPAKVLDDSPTERDPRAQSKPRAESAPLPNASVVRADPMAETLDMRSLRPRSSTAPPVPTPAAGRPPTRPPPIAQPPIVPQTATMTAIGSINSLPNSLPNSPPTSAVPLGSAQPQVTLMGSGPYLPRGSRASMPNMPQSGPQAKPPIGRVLGAGDPQSMVSIPRPRLPAQSGPPLRWWIIGGSLLGIVLTTIIVLATRGDAPPAVLDEHRDAAVIAPDATPAAVTPAVIDAAGVESDEEPDAAPDAAVEPSIEPETAELNEFSAMPDPPKPPAATVRLRLRTKDDLNKAYRMYRFKEIVTACKQLGADDNKAIVCTLAACWTRSSVAQEWFRNVPPNNRDGTITECKRRGLAIRDVCAADPMSCRK